MANTVIMGQGYVGLPLAQGLANTKTQTSVLGFDVSERVVNNLNKGISHIDDISDAEVKDLVAFLNALTDKTFVENPRHGNPWTARR